MRRVGIWTLGAAALAAALAIALGGGGSPYVVRVKLADAAGLRQQSPVMIGGVPAGTISLHLGAGDQVVADLNLDRSQAPVGKDASVAIAAVNFLGQKEAELSRGNVSDPAPSGFVIPASHVTVATDLDQVLDVLDSSTRARLAILIDEAGTAMTGRKADFSELLGQLPHSLVDANALLTRLVADNHTLGDLVTSSDQFVTQLTPQRAQLARMISAVGQAAVTVAARRGALSQTLARAPATLTTLQAFLGKLKATTVPLGPAANNILATAPYLSATLAQVAPFQQAAGPTLVAARKVAPELVQLAAGATPVVVKATPVVRSLATFAVALAPVSQILNRSVDNLLAVVDNWSRAIQFRDGLSHVFRGEAGITADVLTSVIDRLLKGGSARDRSHARAIAGAARPHGAAPQASGSTRARRPPVNVAGLLKKVAAVVGSARVPSAPGTPLSSLLNYLVKP